MVYGANLSFFLGYLVDPQLLQMHAINCVLRRGRARLVLAAHSHLRIRSAGEVRAALRYVVLARETLARVRVGPCPRVCIYFIYEAFVFVFIYLICIRLATP